MAGRKGAAVKFGTPPPQRQSPYDWDKIAAELRNKPGEWGLIFEGDKTSLVTAIRLNGIKALKAHKGFEVRTSNNVKGSPRTCDLWLRYVPEKDAEKEED
jgi:hypothetical protein